MNHQTGLDITGIPKELELMLEWMRSESEPNADAGRLAEIDWSLFLELALHHRIFPVLFTKIKNLEGVPGHVVQALNQQYRSNTFRMLQLSAEMELLSRLLDEQQIRVLHLKGPVLASDLYGDLSLRTCGDLDILVPMNDVENVDQLLTGLGYEKDDYIETVLGDWKWRHHHVTYFHSEKPIKVEIHWRLNPGPGFEPSFDELWERKRISGLTSTPVYFLDREDLFFFLVTHGARHGWSRLRWLTDMDRILRQDLDWKKLEKVMNNYHSLHTGGQALILASQLLHSPLPKEAEPFIRSSRSFQLAQEAIYYVERMVNLHSYPVPDDIAEYHKKHLFSLMPPQQKVLFILSFLYPYPEDADTLPLPKKWHFLYFPLRPFLWTWRKSTKQSWRKRRAS
jgi:hypothetical protein